MNQPIEDRFKQLEERLYKVEQQHTEPIKVIVERRQVEIERTQDNHTAMLRELSIKSDTHTTTLQTLVGIVTPMNRELAQTRLQLNRIDDRLSMIEENSTYLQADVTTLKTDMKETRADVASLRATQSDHGELLREYGKRFDKLEASQNEHSSLLRQILAKLP